MEKPKSATLPAAARSSGDGSSVTKFLRRLSLKSEPKSYEIEPTNTFIVQTIGKVERTQPGDEGLDKCLQSLYKTAMLMKDDLLKVKISISADNVTMTGLGGKLIENEDEIIVPFSRITFVVADRKHQLFAFNDQVSNKPRKVISYAFVCSDGESSETIAATLSTAFQAKVGRRRSWQRSRRFSQDGEYL